MTKKPTPGPWEVRIGTSSRSGTFDIKQTDTAGGDLIVWMLKHNKANADLIVAACNAAQEANPENPIAAARALPALLTALKNLTRYVQTQVENPANLVTGYQLAALKAIAQVEGREP